MQLLGVAYVLQNAQTASDIAVCDLCDLTQHLIFYVNSFLLRDFLESFRHSILFNLSEIHYNGFRSQLFESFNKGIVADENYRTGNQGVFLVMGWLCFRQI